MGLGSHVSRIFIDLGILKGYAMKGFCFCGEHEVYRRREGLQSLRSAAFTSHVGFTKRARGVQIGVYADCIGFRA